MLPCYLMKNKLPIICGSIDAGLTIILVVVFAVVAGKSPSELLAKYQGLLLIVLIIALIAGWRGYVDAIKLLLNDHSWLRPARDGFLIGSIPLPVSHLIGILQEAFAAGPPWPALGYSPLSEWLKYIVWMIGWSILFGGAGALYGMVLSGINRIIVNKIPE